MFYSCSGTMATAKKAYQIKNEKSLKKDWITNAQEWFYTNYVLFGKGNPEHWGVISSKKKLPQNYEITFKVNMTSESLFEVMLNIDDENYIRTYLYQIDQNIVIGKGIYRKHSDEYNKRGGPTLFKSPIKLEQNKWYAVKIKVLNRQLFFSVDNTFLECSIEKSNLSQQGRLGFLTNEKTEIKDLLVKNLN